MTAHEAFIIGMVWGAFSRGLPEGFELERPTLEGPASLVVRGKKTGIEVLVTVTETRPVREDAPAFRFVDKP